MKKLINDKSFKKSFRIVIFFILFISLTFGGFTLCKLVFDTSDGTFWDGTVATSFASGSGTSTDPYIVSTPEEFALIESECTDGVYIKLLNDIYFRPSSTYIEYDETNDSYIMNYGNNTSTFDPEDDTFADGDAALISYSTTTESTSCHINGNNHKVYGLYIKGNSLSYSSFLYNFSGTISNIFFQNTFIYGQGTSFINTINNGVIEDLYFDGVIDNQNSTYGASLINNSTSSNYSRIKTSGYINSNSNISGLIITSDSDYIELFQLNSTLNTRNDDRVYPFIKSANNTSGINNGYYNGNINGDTYINANVYSNVYALGRLNGTLTNYTSGTNIVSQTLSDTSSNYIIEDSIIEMINESFTTYEYFWKIEDEVLPELKMNTSSSVLTATLTITDTTTSSNYHEYTSTINSPNIYPMSDGFDFEVSNITNASLLKEIGYYLSSSILTDPSSVTYTDLTADEITINTTGNYIVYIKITDIDNNVTYINSDMIMVGNIAYYTKTTTATEIINRDIIISETYTLTNTEPSGGYRRLSVSSIPEGTKIVLIDSNIAYTYTATGAEDYINLSSFKVMNSITDSYHSGTGSSSITLYYDFNNTMGGTLNVNLQYYNNNIIQGYTTTETNDTTIIDSVSTGTSTISITSSDTINLNTIGSYNINYNITSSSATEYHYLTYSLYNSSNTKVTNSVIDGISITYDGNKYYSDSNGNIIIPLGYISSTSISTTLNVEHLNNVNIPGTYYIKMQIDDDNTIQYQVSLSYMTNNILKDKMVVDYTNQVLYKDTNRTLTFTIYNDTETSLYQNEIISASVSLYKKETLGSSTYSLIDISNYTSLNEAVNTSDKSYMLNDDLDKYNSNPASIVFNNSITTGAYQLKIDYYIENTYVSSDYIYFIVK